jgi:sporulation protein YlmC with PRC-barrel domain
VSELLKCVVVDEDGDRLGRVHDVRLVQDGPMLGGFESTFRVDGLVVGPGSVATRLGYDRAGVKGPWSVKVLFERLRGASHYVPWDRIRDIEAGTILISGSGRDLEPPAEVRDHS